MTDTPPREDDASERPNSGATAVRPDAFDTITATAETVQRAEAESYTFAPAAAGRVNVRNDSHDDPGGHIYTVMLLDGLPARCTCPADRYHDGACKHRVALALAAQSTTEDG